MALSDRQSTASLPDAASETGLTEAEAKRRLDRRGRRRRRGTGRSYLSIIVANVFTVFNLILVAFGVITLVFGDARDALFLGILVVNSGIGIYQEVRAKRAVDRLSCSSLRARTWYATASRGRCRSRTSCPTTS